MYQETEYVYSRIKNTFVNDNGVLELFLFAGLTKNTIDYFQHMTKEKHVKSIVSKVVELPLKDALTSYTSMINHDSRFVIDKMEFERLEHLSKIDEVSFFTYKI